ncbi:MAG: precorrin-6y C5,15-methyltransferase (decarboxylating) subunit CbiE [Marmoricola sp.]
MVPSTKPRITVIGIGADGWTSVPEASWHRLLRAGVVLGGARHLAMLPDLPDQVREPWPSPLRDNLPALLEKYAGREVVALASGDPLVSGIGSTLTALLGEEAVRIEPAVSSVAIARARMSWPAEQVEMVSAVGRDAHAVLRLLAPGHRVLVLSSDAGTPDEVARLLREAGYGASRMIVLGNLGAPDESRTDGVADTWSHKSPALNVIALVLQGPVVGPRSGGLPDEAFEHDGQVTKRDVRASAMARLAPQPGQLLWDVGAGAGSVGIEWMRAHATCWTVAIEADETRAARVSANAGRLGVPTLRVVLGRAPDALGDLPRPDAVFVGGGATAPGLLEACLAALRPGGRLVVHGVTLETETLLAQLYAEHGGELTRIAVEHASPIGGFTGWTPARAVTQWAVSV